MVNERVIEFLKSNGPSLPVEIGKAIGYDSFLTKAILSELINKGLVKHSNRPIGGSLIYFLPEQVNSMRERLRRDLSLGERQVLDKIAGLGRVKLSELTPHDRAFIKRIIDFLIVKRLGDDYLITYYGYSEPVSKPVSQPVKPVSQPVKPVIEPVRVIPKGFISKAEEFINLIGRVTSKVKVKSNEYDFLVSVSKPFKQELFIKVKDKKSITESDISSVFAEALRVKRPAIILTNGSVSKRADKWRQANTGSLVNVIKI